jgi:hypothetical protein
MKKFGYWCAIVIASLLISLNPLQAARLVPGTVPDTQPLQPIPDAGAQPNYSGNFNSTTEVAPEIQNNNQEDDSAAENSNTDSNNPETASAGNSMVSTNTQIWLWLNSIIIAGILAFLWYRYRIRKAKK